MFNIKKYNLYYIVISSLGLLSGIIFYLFYHEYIIISFPNTHYLSYQTIKTNAHKKTITFCYWNKSQFDSEEKEVIITDNKAQTLEYIINSWLSLLDEEQSMVKKIGVELVMVDYQGKDAFISFDRNPFDKQASLYEKWMWIEGLLKTVKNSGITVENITFLVHHKTLNDSHLDFTQAWPLHGFL